MQTTIAEQIEEAAVQLAIESRSLLGLPLYGNACQDSSWIVKLDQPPNALQFARHVNRHVPLLINGCIQSRYCWQSWQSSAYMIDVMGNRTVQVALTPNGRADDVHRQEEMGKDVFVLPMEEQLTFEQLFTLLKNNANSSCIAYLQSQNSNLTVEDQHGSGDLSPLLNDIRSTINNQKGPASSSSKSASGSYAWADEALNCEPEATNLWIGTKESKTSMHRDHYENIFSVVRGTKIFTLYPPCEAHFLCEGEPYDVYQWTRDKEKNDWKLIPSASPPTPWIPIDPTQPSSSARNARYPLYAKALAPLVVEVHAGQTLYLPAGWYHHVAQRGDDDDIDGGVCICVNWWYDSDFAFSDRWALEQFVKDIGQLSRTTSSS